MPTPGACAAALLALFTLLSSPASAQLPSQISIEWTGSPLCQRSAALDGEVLRLVGPAAGRIEPTQFLARVDELAERSTNYYRLTLRVRSASRNAERSVELPTCGDVQDAAALLIASAIDPTATFRVPPPAPPKDEPAGKDEENEDDAEDDAEARLSRNLSHPWSVRAQVGFDLQSLPQPTMSLGVGVLLQQAGYRFWSEARYLFAGEDVSREVATNVDLFAGALGASFMWSLGAFQLGPALEAELGLFRANTESREFEGRNSNALWSSALFGVVAAYAVHARVGVDLGVFGGVPLRQLALGVNPGADELDTVYTTAPVTMRLALGLRVSLGSD